MMKLIESLYFVFFLPLSTYNNSKLKGIFFMTLYITIFSQINLCLFNIFHVCMKKGSFWSTDLEIFGYWDEVPDTYKSSKADFEFNHRCKNYTIGDVVMYNTKRFKFLGFRPQETWGWIDKK